MHRAPRVPLLVALLAALVGLAAACGPTVTPPASPPGSVGPPTDRPTGTPGPSGSGSPGTASATPLRAAWALLDAAPGPDERAGHSWSVDPSAAMAWLFGGRSGSTTFDDLWQYDLNADAWFRVEPDGLAPGGRSGHAAGWVDGAGLVVAGGTGADGRPLGDTWVLDPDETAWREIDTEPGPGARTGACAATGPDGRLWLVGGRTGDGRPLDDVWAWAPESEAWTDATPAGSGPIARSDAACWWTDEGSLIIAGGRGDEPLDDVWALPDAGAPDAAWQEAGTLPAARWGATGARGPRAAVLFGGSDDGEPTAELLQVGAGATIRPIAGGDPAPSGRTGATLVPDPGGERFLLFGGETADGPTDELWELRLR